jgi:hypothetical protein
LLVVVPPMVYHFSTMAGALFIFNVNASMF